MREILAPHAITKVEAPPNYSVLLTDPPADGVTPFHFLFRGCTTVLRARHAESVLRGLVRRLDEHAFGSDGSVLRLHATACIRSGQAFLLPTWVGQHGPSRELLIRRGFVPLEGSLVDIELDRGHLLIAPPRLQVDDKSLDLWSARFDAGRGTAQRAAAGTYPVVAWLFVDRTGAEAITRMPDALTRGLGVVRNGHAVGPARTLRTLAAVLRQARPATLPRETHDVAAFVDGFVNA